MSNTGESQVPDYLIKQVLSSNESNIFDVFAALYSYCKGFSEDLLNDLSNTRIKRKFTRDSIQIQHTMLPKTRNARKALEGSTKENLLTFIESDPGQYSLQCLTVLEAIDKYYENIYADCAVEANYSTFSGSVQPLNLDESLGRVYPKSKAPILDLIQKRVDDWTQKGNEYFALRRRDDLSSHFINLVFIKAPDGYEVSLGLMDSSIWQFFPELIKCKIGLIPLIRNMDQMNKKEFPFDGDNNRPFVFTGLNENDKIVDSIKEILKELNDLGATIVVFPELSMPEETKNKVATWLNDGFFPSIKMLIAGSFHYLIEDKWFNIAHVLGPDGEQLWEQKKCKSYTLTRAEARHIESLKSWSDHDSRENISTSPKTLVLYDTPLGRTLILICKDFLLENPEHQQIIVDMGVDCVIVPSMTPKLEHQFTMAASVYSNRARVSTIVSNSCALAREYQTYDKQKGEDKGNKIEVKISFIYLPGFRQDTWQTCSVAANECAGNNCMKYFLFNIGDWVPSN